MLKAYLKSQIDLPVYLFGFILSALLMHLATSVESISVHDDEFAEFEDPDDTFTVDLTDSISPDRSKTGDPHLDKHGILDDNGSSERSSAATNSQSAAQIDDDIPIAIRKPMPLKPSDSIEDGIVDEVDEPENMEFRDDEEFEGFSPSSREANSDQISSQKKAPNLIITKVPRHLTGSWDSYQLEMLIVGLLSVYICNYMVGRSKNGQLASAWFDAHKPLLEAQFTLVGDDGQAEPGSGTLVKESEHLYSLWCSGRVACEAMLVELRLARRQCLIHQFSSLLRPSYDTIVAKVVMDDAEMDGWVMAVGRKRCVQALAKDHFDLTTFCPDRRGLRHPGLPDSFTVLSELPEATTTMLNGPVCKFLTDNEDSVEYLFFSDQYTGPKPSSEETPPAQLPVTQKVLIFSFRVGNKGSVSVEDMGSTAPLFQFVFFIVEKVRRFRLNKESKMKSERNRQRAYESRLKSVHTQRQEAAQSRREERLRANKERIMAEEDPEKARKMEEREQRREKAKKMPKIKMLKSRGM